MEKDLVVVGVDITTIPSFLKLSGYSRDIPCTDCRPPLMDEFAVKIIVV